MSILKAEDSKKWINAFVAIGCILLGYILIQFIGQLGEWFELEAKIPNFIALTQGLGIVTGIVSFIFVLKNKLATQHVGEVYSELVKVIWPDRDSTFKATIGIIIGVSIISGLFVLVDYLVQKLLALVY